MRVSLNVCVAAIAAFAFALPVWARTESASLTLNKPATIGTTTLKPGTYRFVTQPSTNDIRVEENGRTVATVPGKWISLKNKSPYTDVVLSNDQIQEIDFSGKMQAIRIG